jgi:DNA-binding XRE family transcriptional regulator
LSLGDNIEATGDGGTHASRVRPSAVWGVREQMNDQEAAATDVSLVPSNGDLGRAIRRLRTERYLTIKGLARIAQIDDTYLTHIELGHSNPTWLKLAEIAMALEMPISAVIHEAEVEAQIAAGMRLVRSKLGLSAESYIQDT